MKENQLIKYNKDQIEKVNNLVAITNKLLIVQKETFETDKRLLAMMAIKKQVLDLRAEKQRNVESFQTISEERSISSKEKFEKQLDFINKLPAKQQTEFKRRLAMILRKVKKELK